MNDRSGIGQLLSGTIRDLFQFVYLTAVIILIADVSWHLILVDEITGLTLAQAFLIL